MLQTRAQTEAADDAAKYLRKRNISAAHGSSLKKLYRAKRIGAGLRPFRMTGPKSHTITVVNQFGFAIGKQIITYDLHPTKGIRNFRSVYRAA